VSERLRRAHRGVRGGAGGSGAVPPIFFFGPTYFRDDIFLG
jgi:hypothetical protein